MIDLPDSWFPNDGDLGSGFWQPVFFRFNFDTPERLVVAILANVDGTWHLEAANSLNRLNCLYGREAEIAVEVIHHGLSDLEEQLSNLSPDRGPALTVSGLTLGNRMEGQSWDAGSLARRWLNLSSSLHDAKKEFQHSVPSEATQAASAVETLIRDISKDRLSVLVMESMTKVAPQIRNHFNAHVRKLERDHGARLLTHKAYVAYDGRKIAANFATLKAGRNKVSVDIAKRLMWDLEQHRDTVDAGLLEPQKHEMFLYHPSRLDPTITEKQYDNVMEVVGTLSEEGAKREIVVQSHDSVDGISDKLLAEEGIR